MKMSGADRHRTARLFSTVFGIVCLFVAVGSVGSAKEEFATGFIQIFPDGGCELNKEAIRCDRVAPRLRAMPLSPGFDVLLAVDEAPYEAVVAMQDSLKENGIKDVTMMPPFLGTTPSKSVNHWIKFVVEGLVNHPFQMVMISTEQFRTWRETLIVLSPSDFAIVDALITARVAQTDCLTSPVGLPMDLRGKEHRLLMFEHSGQVTHSCLIPRAATSCGFLSAVMGLANIRWTAADLEAIHSVAGEIGCNSGG